MSTSTDATAAAVTDAAIGWLVQLRSGEATPADQAAFGAWLDRDAAHRRAWERLAGPVDGAFAAARAATGRAPVRADAVAEVLAQASAQARRRRRVLRGALGLAGTAVGSTLVAQRFVPLQDVLADYGTGTGERRRFDLPDGSTLLLNARSAADAAWDDGSRRLRLRGGACILDVRPDAQRPFMARCRQGGVRVAAGEAARFLLRQDEARGLAVALGGHMEAVSADGAVHRTLAPGEAAWLAPEGLMPAPGAAPAAAAWQQGWFLADDQPLGDVVAALQAYRPGLLRIAPEAARLRVHGSYPLDDSERALSMIADTLPVTVHRHSGGWLVRIEPA